MAKNQTDSKTGSASADQVIAIFDTKKIYLEEVSFEAPLTPAIFTRTDVKPAFDIQTMDQAVAQTAAAEVTDKPN